MPEPDSLRAKLLDLQAIIDPLEELLDGQYEGETLAKVLAAAVRAKQAAEQP